MWMESSSNSSGCWTTVKEREGSICKSYSHFRNVLWANRVPKFTPSMLPHFYQFLGLDKADTRLCLHCHKKNSLEKILLRIKRAHVLICWLRGQQKHCRPAKRQKNIATPKAECFHIKESLSPSTHICNLIRTHTCTCFHFRVYMVKSHTFKKLLNFKTTAETNSANLRKICLIGTVN